MRFLTCDRPRLCSLRGLFAPGLLGKNDFLYGDPNHHDHHRPYIREGNPVQTGPPCGGVQLIAHTCEPPIVAGDFPDASRGESAGCSRPEKAEEASPFRMRAVLASLQVSCVHFVERLI